MAKSKAKAGAATKHSLKAKDDTEKLRQIQQILESPFPTNSVWEPTDEEMEHLQIHVSDGGERDEHIIQLENKLNPIYDIVPHVLHHCWSLNFSKKNEDVSVTIQSKYGERYTLHCEDSMTFPKTYCVYVILGSTNTPRVKDGIKG